ncbi:lycopene cyclase domain-containing protein [Salinispira pacifica]|uniref:Lycopene cyclase n=1 Tax=Salinispira pacifica TaxID=1307761 RepID=V5WDX1_9SPIO|nr:lycopene cyclase domain-containing protein [Salinispira pacifica]AHC13825.1 Lycopene cyclase [Salinispira pacifica]
MKKHVYAIIAVLSFAGPFAMSFDRKVHYISYLPPLLIATLAVGALYIAWDVMVTSRGHWQFNDEFVGSTRLFHLPVGEWLFFLLIPYPSVFIYEVILAYFGTSPARPELAWIQFVLAAGFIIPAYIWRKQGYTLLAMLSASLYFLVSGFLTPGVIAASGYLWSMLLIFLAFVVVNGIYTALPTIRYNPKAIFGVKFIQIPVEDFFYNLSYIGLILTLYIPLKEVMGL